MTDPVRISGELAMPDDMTAYVLSFSEIEDEFGAPWDFGCLIRERKGCAWVLYLFVPENPDRDCDYVLYPDLEQSLAVADNIVRIESGFDVDDEADYGVPCRVAAAVRNATFGNTPIGHILCGRAKPRVPEPDGGARTSHGIDP